VSVGEKLENPVFYTVREAAGILRCNKNTLEVTAIQRRTSSERVSKYLFASDALLTGGIAAI
jgi:hypothetical protein